MAAPLAYFLTWTTYGTWLHGDARGSIDDDHNRYQRPTITPNNARRSVAAELLTEPSFILSADDRTVVRDAVRERCDVKHWLIRAINVRTNHAHLVVSVRDEPPEVVMQSLKSWATRGLRSRHPERKKFWTRNGSTRYLWDEASIHDACRYVFDAQDNARRFQTDR